MNVRRFRHFTGIDCPWIVALFFGIVWYGLTFGWEETPGDDGSIPPDPDVVSRYVDREIMLLEGGKDKGPFIRWWTGQEDRSKTLKGLATLLEKCEGDLEADLAKQQVMRLAGGPTQPIVLPEGWNERLIKEAVIEGDFGPTVKSLYFPNGPKFKEQQNELLRRSFLVGGIFIASAIGVLFAVPYLFRNRAGGGPGWRLTGQWHPSLVLTVFFVAEIVGLVGIGIYLSNVIYAYGDPRLGPILATFLSQGAAAVIATLVLLTASPAVIRVYGFDQPVRWRLVLAVLVCLYAIGWLQQWIGVTSNVADPSDFLAVVDPDGFQLLNDILSGVIAAPLFEEILFRGVLFIGLMRRLGAGWAAILSSFVFAIVHLQYDPVQLISIWIFGMACCWLTWRTQSIKPGIILHMIYNGVITLDVYLLYQQAL